MRRPTTISEPLGNSATPELQALILTLAEQNDVLQRRVAGLEARLNLASVDRRACPRCGVMTRAEWPADVPRGRPVHAPGAFAVAFTIARTRGAEAARALLGTKPGQVDDRWGMFDEQDGMRDDLRGDRRES